MAQNRALPGTPEMANQRGQDVQTPKLDHLERSTPKGHDLTHIAKCGLWDVKSRRTG